jgi:hypothetical protein
MWVDIESLAADQNLPSDTLFPQCPSCGLENAEFSKASIEELEERKLARFSAGESV